MDKKSSRVSSEPDLGLPGEVNSQAQSKSADAIVVATGYTAAEILGDKTSQPGEQYDDFDEASFPFRNRDRGHSPKLYKPRTPRILQGNA